MPYAWSDISQLGPGIEMHWLSTLPGSRLTGCLALRLQSWNSAFRAFAAV